MRVYGRVRYTSAYTDVSSNKFHIISANKLNKSIGRHKVNDKSIQKQTIVSFLFKKCCSDRAEAPIEDGSQSSSNRKVTPSQAARIAKTATCGGASGVPVVAALKLPGQPVGLPAMTNPAFRGPSFVYVCCEGRSRSDSTTNKSNINRFPKHCRRKFGRRRR